MKEEESIYDNDSTGQDWLETYQRGHVPHRNYPAEHLTERGESLLNVIWDRIAPSLQARMPELDISQLPSSMEKWAILPDWVQLMVEHPFKGRNVFDWLDGVLEGKDEIVFRDGCMVLRRTGKATARRKHYGQGVCDPTPAFTFHGERLPYGEFKDILTQWIEKAYKDGRYSSERLYRADLDSLSSWEKVQGGRAGTYVFAESSMLYHGMTPHQETAYPIPEDVFWQAWDKVMDKEWPGFKDDPNMYLDPKHLFVGTSTSGGIVLPNYDAAAGMYFSEKEADEIAKLMGIKEFKGRPTKGRVFQEALRRAVAWIKGGMPMFGPLYEDVAIPATLASRGDREVELFLRFLASRGSDQAFHDAADQLAALLPSRSVIIVALVLVLLQSTYAQPMSANVSSRAPPGYGWVDPAHDSNRLHEIRNADMNPSERDAGIQSCGADAGGYDRDVVGQDHSGETALYCAVSPKNVTLLYADCAYPMDVKQTWVATKVQELGAGGTETVEVPIVKRDGSIGVAPATLEVISFNYHEMICKVMTMINDSPIQWGDYEVDAPGHLFKLENCSVDWLQDLYIVSNGGRTSGDAITGLGNNHSNLIKHESMAIMSRDRKYAGLISRRCKRQDTPPCKKGYYLQDAYAKGDDTAVLIKPVDPKEKSSIAVASGYCSVGMRANAKKQEASDIPGVPEFGFAKIYVDGTHIGKLLGNTGKRYLVQELRGVNLDIINAVAENNNVSDLSDILIATTATAKSRLAPLTGFILLDEHPLAFDIVEWAVHNDKHRLLYITEDSLQDDGTLTPEAEERNVRAKMVEAKAQARLLARRMNVAADLDELVNQYLTGSIHELIEEVALVDNYVPTKQMDRVNNAELFQKMVTADSYVPL